MKIQYNFRFTILFECDYCDGGVSEVFFGIEWNVFEGNNFGIIFNLFGIERDVNNGGIFCGWMKLNRIYSSATN